MSRSFLQSVRHNHVSIQVLRTDLNHPIVQGNKLWKLKYHLIEAEQRNAQTLLTFGGAYSNHLLATAFAAQEKGFESIGVVRGEELASQPDRWSHTLHQAKGYGMELVFFSREDYRLKADCPTVQELLAGNPNTYIIPEGGSGSLAIQGVSEGFQAVVGDLEEAPTHLFCPVGTGGTLMGLMAAVNQLKWRCQVCAVPVLKGLQSVNDLVNQWLSNEENTLNWQWLSEYHFGGYAKSTTELKAFAIDFEQKQQIPLDKIYNAKSFYALCDWIEQGRITADDRPMIIHTGGLQGGTFGDEHESSD